MDPRDTCAWLPSDWLPIYKSGCTSVPVMGWEYTDCAMQSIIMMKVGVAE